MAERGAFTFLYDPATHTWTAVCDGCGREWSTLTPKQERQIRTSGWPANAYLHSELFRVLEEHFETRNIVGVCKRRP